MSAALLMLSACGAGKSQSLQTLESKLIAKYGCNPKEMTINRTGGNEGKPGAEYVANCSGKSYEYRYMGDNKWRMFNEDVVNENGKEVEMVDSNGNNEQ
jgi:hypothetical protein